MTEQELNNRITEILKVSEKDAQLCQTSGGRRTGRQYRRVQRARHDDRLLFLIQHSGYAPNIGYIIGDYEEDDAASFRPAHQVHEIQQSAAVSETEGQSQGS